MSDLQKDPLFLLEDAIKRVCFHIDETMPKVKKELDILDKQTKKWLKLCRASDRRMKKLRKTVLDIDLDRKRQIRVPKKVKA